MSPDEVDDIANSVLADDPIGGREIDPAFRDLLVRVSAGELTVDAAMTIARENRTRNGER